MGIMKSFLGRSCSEAPYTAPPLSRDASSSVDRAPPSFVRTIYPLGIPTLHWIPSFPAFYLSYTRAPFTLEGFVFQRVLLLPKRPAEYGRPEVECSSLTMTHSKSFVESSGVCVWVCTYADIFHSVLEVTKRRGTLSN